MGLFVCFLVFVTVIVNFIFIFGRQGLSMQLPLNSCYVDPAGLELTETGLPLLTEYWD